MEEEIKQTEIKLTDLWTILKKCWWLMAIVLVVVTVAVFVIQKVRYEPTYTATVSIWAIKSDTSENTSGNYYDMVIATNLVNDYKEIALKDEVVRRVIAANNWDITIAEFKKLTTISHESNTRILDLSVTAASPDSAKRAAESWAQIFCEFITETRKEEMILPLGEATLPEKPSNPISLLKILLVSFVAAIVVYGIYFLRFIMDDKVNTPEDVERYLGLNVLGAIPNKNHLSRRREKYGYYYASSTKGDTKSK